MCLSKRKKDSPSKKSSSKEKLSSEETSSKKNSQSLVKDLESSLQALKILTKEQDSTIKAGLLKETLVLLEQNYKKRSMIDFSLKLQTSSSLDSQTVQEKIDQLIENESSLEELGAFIQQKQPLSKGPVRIAKRNIQTDININPDIREITFSISEK